MKRVLLGLWGLSWAGLVLGAEPPAPRAAALDRDNLPAAGTHSAILTVTRFGRYAIRVKSEQGTALQLVDRMAGPGDPDGEPGVRDGRLDVFLERGEYKILSRGHRAATGTVRLSVEPFVEKSATRPPRLLELKPVDGELRDLEQVSYWIEVGARRNVWLEAAGRALTDLRLWRDGEWLVDAAPEREHVQPKVGQPVFVYRISTALDPGLYRLTAYGGAPQPWSEGDGHPLHIRFGIPEIGEPSRERHAVGPFGIDRYRITAVANYFRLELPEAAPLLAHVGTFNPQAAFSDQAETSLEVTKKSVPPGAEVEVASHEHGERFVTVRGAPGQPYVLQAFQRADQYELARSGAHWISTVHSGDPADNVDATAILVEAGSRRAVPMQTGVVPLDARTAWSRRANLLSTLTVFFDVKEAGAYTIVSEGTSARFRLEPFMIRRPERYQPPAFRDSGARWDLDAGLYVLTVEPVRKGILDVVLKPAGLLDAALEATGLGPDRAPAPAQAAVIFAEAALLAESRYTVYVNQRPGVSTGLVLRALPLDLADPLPLALRPGETARVPFEAGEAGRLTALAEDGSRLSLSVDDGPWQETASVARGRHVVTVKAASKTLPASLRLLPESRDPSAPLPELPDSALAALPKWPIVTDEAPRFFDLAHGASTTFNVRAEKAGLYRLETTGLLAMKGDLRTRTLTSFASAEANGTGRNALLQQYLREGDYQVTVAARGGSAGHAGLVLSRGAAAAGGFLTSGMPARVTLPAGQAVSYRFNITRPGRFRVRAFGLGRRLRARLEDLDGWPVVAPGGDADLTRDFEPGKYRLVVLPEAHTARVLTVIEPLRARRQVKGHGPHRLGLGESIEHVWVEPEEGAPRRPDVWEWAIPARVTARLALGGDMAGELVRQEGDDVRTVIASVPPGRGWSGPLERGRYRLEAVNSRKNNRVPYEVALSTEELVAGQERALSAPAELPVSVGEAGLVEISSFGTDDVQARLLDAGGRVVARSDDRPDDWNFLLVHALVPGMYRLRVDPVGEAAAETRVSFRVPRDEEQPPPVLPAALDVTVGRTSRLYPLTLPAGAELVVAEARSPTSVGLALERRDGEAWRSVTSSLGRRPRIAAALASEPVPYRLRVWSVDRREATLRLALAAPVPVTADEAQLRKGITVPAAAGLISGTVRVTLDRPGLLRVADGVSALWCDTPGQACRAQEGDLVPAAQRRLFVVGEIPTLKAERVFLDDETPLTVRVAAGASAVCDVRDHDGVVVVTATSPVSAPGISLGGSSEEGGSSAMAAGPQSSVTVATPARGLSARVWNASGSSAMEIRLTARHGPRPRGVKTEAGRWEGTVDAPTSVRLGGGGKRARLALGEAVVAAVLDGKGRARSVHWGSGKPLVETFDTDAEEMLLVAPSPSARAEVAVLPLGKTAPTTLAAGAPYERRFAEVGSVRIAVAGAEGGRLHVRGGEAEAAFMTAAGRITYGRDFDVDAAGGTLLVSHAAGWVLAWIDRAGQEGEALWPAPGGAEARRLETPALVDLSATPGFLVEVSQPAMLHFRSASPLVTRVTRSGEAAAVEIHSESAAFDAYLKPGRNAVEVRALGGGSLIGTAEVTSTPVTVIGDGLGPEVLLAPGTTRVFSFEVPTERVIGVGVRAGAEVVEAVLLDARGAVIGRGAAQMRTLAAGTYLLALQAPADASPAVARPAIVGLAQPDTGPPEDVVRQYVAPEDPASAFASTRVEERDLRRQWYGDPQSQSTERSLEPQGEWESDVPVETEGEMEEGAVGEETPEEESEGGPQ